jgi:hypothetical protein
MDKGLINRLNSSARNFLEKETTVAALDKLGEINGILPASNAQIWIPRLS